MASKKRPVLVAPDKFKGTFSAEQVARPSPTVLARVGIDSDICRIADGGEGTLEIVVEAVGGEVVECAVERCARARW